MLGNGRVSLQMSKRLQGEARVLPEQVPAQLCVPHSRYFPSSPQGLGGKIPTRLQGAGSSTMSLQWQCPRNGSVFLQGSVGSVLVQGSRGWDPQRQGRGLQGCGPFLPLLLLARGRILHCNFKCYNFLITSSQTMSSLCGEGPPPSRLALHARRLPAPGLLWMRTVASFWTGN